MNQRSRIVRAGALGALLSTLLLGGQVTQATASDAPTPTTSATAIAVAPLAFGDICYSDLPPEAHDTLDLIEAGGPFPYPQDGGTFYNREGLLPSQPTGYYHEYTVETPGSSTRGERRIVTGESHQEDYYTADHYESFDLVDYAC
ncbi:ribonuclease domain-containing protein [Streptomyces sp. URMC 129]|uniref:ribonuclease domain-containing protein n=1 Tax=Streptomyces sp. URMC 129 TaxID=3423407 RepID=UPI003F1BD597